jgi:hypothetical protein
MVPPKQVIVTDEQDATPKNYLFRDLLGTSSLKEGAVEVIGEESSLHKKIT